jgi:Asp-tRNA(Asn)/Glu-tRNA(Gln) amidotransferase A subunit family amidase
MSKKWYNYFVSVDGSGADDSQAAAGQGSTGGSKGAAQSVAEIAASIGAEPKFTTPVSDPTSFDEIYRAAEIPEAPQGYSILKVAHMLESEHIRNLPSDVKKSSVLVALEAAGADIKDVIQDAVRRDRALDTYERVQQRAVDELENGKNKENGEIQAQIDKYLTEQRAKIQANNDEIAREKERITGWRLKKQQEEKRIADAVGYFVSENPITTGPVQAQPPVSKTAQRS